MSVIVCSWRSTVWLMCCVWLSCWTAETPTRADLWRVVTKLARRHGISRRLISTDICDRRRRRLRRRHLRHFRSDISSWTSAARCTVGVKCCITGDIIGWRRRADAAWNVTWSTSIATCGSTSVGWTTQSGRIEWLAIGDSLLDCLTDCSSSCTSARSPCRLPPSSLKADYPTICPHR